MVLALLVSGSLALNVVDVGRASVAKNLPFENKDAYFTAPPNFYGIFDGVSACPESRIYSQTLAKTSCDTLMAVQAREPTLAWDAQAFRALTAAAEAAKKYSGSSTAMLLKLDLDHCQTSLSVIVRKRIRVRPANS